MINTSNLTTDFALDVNGVGNLRLAVKSGSQGSIQEVAKQFESLFVNMMLKSMRDATPKDGIFDSSQNDMYTGILDQQLSQKLSSKGGLGLADFMVKQMTRGQAQPSDQAVINKPQAAAYSLAPKAFAYTPEANRTTAIPGMPGNSPKDFVDKLWTHATEVGKELGIPSQFLIGHAALESGWGQREIRDAAGKNSHNLFGIKAGKNWTGQVVETTTTEYVNGVPKKFVEKFRAYDSYADSFRDYGSLLRNSPRYAAVLEPGQDAAGFARALQDAGYATDPQYASKINRILNSKTMHQALITA